jgi:hypothetical protein
MTVDFAEEAIRLIEVLERNGFATSGLDSSQSFGNRCIVAQNGKIEIRLLRDRGVWFIEAARQPASAWYDIAILKEEILGQVGDDVLSLGQQAAFLKSHLGEIQSLLVTSGSVLRLETRKELRATRRLGELR